MAAMSSTSSISKPFSTGMHYHALDEPAQDLEGFALHLGIGQRCMHVGDLAAIDFRQVRME